MNCKFWSSQDSDAMVLGDVPTIIEKVAYTLANPTKDFVVERPEDWIGVRTRVEDLGTGLGPIYVRPQRFFDAAGPVSECVMLCSELPDAIIDTIGAKEFRKRVTSQVEAMVAAARAAVAAGRGSFVGIDKAKGYSVWHATSRPKGRKAGRDAKARRRVDAATRGRLRAMLDALLAFREAHRAAWLRFREGLDAVFPPGTWMARRYYGARRHDASPPATTAPS